MQRPSDHIALKAQWRAAAAAATCTALGALACWLLLGLAVDAWPTRRAGPPDLDDAVSGLMAWAGVAIAAWLTLGALLCLAGLLPGSIGATCARLAEHLTPRLLRRAVSLALGASIGTVVLPTGTASGAEALHTAVGASLEALGLAGETPTPGFHTDGSGPSSAGQVAGRTAAASPISATHTLAPTPGYVPTASIPTRAPSPGFTAEPVAPGPSAVPTSSAAPTPGWRPEPPKRAVDPERTRLLSPGPRIGTAPLDAVVVHRGDTLWSIAARHLGPSATDTEIAHEWPRWYAANRGVIGADADLILPGTSLVPPTPEITR